MEEYINNEAIEEIAETEETHYEEPCEDLATPDYSESEDDSSDAVGKLVLGLAAVGVVAAGYGLFKAGKWVKGKIVNSEMWKKRKKGKETPPVEGAIDVEYEEYSESETEKE